ncbi:hypothetical protein [uncultured Polaribacter sp.]|uniref:hypothetical protein n=1 Tax=uncultured Polaribacter sp. TaxID=174711 RepID=UPI00262B8E8C|nr:hypothetical protein [uncultured Polaribacter sp.]
MNKLWKFFQYGYLILAVICFVEGIIKFTENNYVTGSILIGTAVLVTILFLVKRRFRKRIQNNQNKK